LDLKKVCFAKGLLSRDKKKAAKAFRPPGLFSAFVAVFDFTLTEERLDVKATRHFLQELVKIP